MTAFRDQLAADVSAVFLNADEFGEPIYVDGVLVTAVVEGDATAGVGAVGSRAVGAGDLDEQAFTRRLTIHLATGQIDRPVDGQALVLVLGGVTATWYVRTVDEAEGVLAIQLERQED